MSVEVRTIYRLHRVGEKSFPLLVAPPVRHPSGILPLHGRVHKKETERIFRAASFIFYEVFI